MTFQALWNNIFVVHHNTLQAWLLPEEGKVCPSCHPLPNRSWTCCASLFTQPLLWQNCFTRGTDKGSAVPALWHGGTTTSNTLVTLWRVTRKAAPGDNYNWCANGELLAAKRQTFPSGFCCALVPIDYWGKCIMLAKISFPWSDVCFISHINASMTLSLLQHIKHLGNVSLNSRSVLWNPSTWE